jgi:GT2 family glycosyltransferase
VALPRGSKRQPGSAVIRAFEAGCRSIQRQGAQFLVKLDCDLNLPPEYFERLIAKFLEDPALGIASGIYLEQHKGSWCPIRLPAYHAAGACKMVRTQCFTQIGGFVPCRGWDTLDEIRAQAAGWTTRHFPELEFYHLKEEGSGIGLLRTSSMHGQIHYLTGGGLFFFALKFLHRLLFGKPFFLSGVAMMFGYVKALASRKQKLVNRDEAVFYRRLLNRRILEGATKLLAPIQLRRRRAAQGVRHLRNLQFQR